MEVKVLEMCDSIFKDSIEKNACTFFLHDDPIASIFTSLTKEKDFDAFAVTSKQMHRIAHSIPVYAFKPVLRKHVLVRHEKYKETETKLLQALSTRSFTPEEAARVGIWEKFKVRFDDEGHQKYLMEITEKAEVDFYNALKKCCFRLDKKINNNNLTVCVTAALNHLLKKSKNCESTILKLRRTMDRLGERVYNDMVAGYVDEPAESVTIESFKKKVNELRGYFTSKGPVAIECSLRQALRLKYHKDFEKIADNCLHSPSTCPIFIQTKEQLITARIKAIETELAKLCGTNGSKGIIGTTFIKFKDLENEMKAAVQMQLLELPSYDCMNIMSLIINELTEVGEIRSRLKTVRNEYDYLLNRLNKITLCCYEGNVHGGKLSSSEESKIEGKARSIVRQLGRFYAELCQEITEFNKEERSRALHRIIGEP
jgi:hypothetical protein